MPMGHRSVFPMNTSTSATAALEIRAELGRQRRSVANLSQETSIPRQRLDRRLNGQSPFNLAEIDAIAHALGTTPGRLLTPRPTPDR